MGCGCGKKNGIAAASDADERIAGEHTSNLVLGRDGISESPAVSAIPATVAVAAVPEKGKLYKKITVFEVWSDGEIVSEHHVFADATAAAAATPNAVLNARHEQKEVVRND